MKKKILVLALFVIFIITLVTGLRAQKTSSKEYDEGGYLNTFYTVSQGNQLYKTTFFSQPPGFFLLTYPGYILFGKTLLSARLTIFFWSLFGLGGIFWLAYELKQKWIALTTIGILFLTSRYYQEIITFHADALPLVFSCLSLASMMRFYNTEKIGWFLLSIGLFITAFWVKFDFSAIFPLTYIFFSKVKKANFSFKKINWILISAVLCVMTLSYLYLSTFNLKDMYVEVVGYHLQAQTYYPFSILRILATFKNNIELFLLIIVVSFLVLKEIKKHKINFSFKILFLWSYSSLFFIVLYRPLLLHHLFTLTIPFALFLSYLLYTFFLKEDNTTQVVKKNATFLFFVLLLQLTISLLSYQQEIPDIQKKAIQIIQSNTKKADYIISDDGLLPAVTARRTPPELVDISEVRINSKYLTLNMIEKSLTSYKPKLIFFWAGRLEKLKGIEELLRKYQYVLSSSIDSKYKVYILVN